MEPSAQLNIGQNVDAIRDLIDAHLAGRTGTWIASFAELMAIADDRGVPIFAMQPIVARRLAQEGDGEQDDAAGREALKDALIGRWAAHIARSDGTSRVGTVPGAGAAHVAPQTRARARTDGVERLPKRPGSATPVRTG